MRAAIYARVSTRGQRQAQTIEQQVTRLETYIQQKGWLLEAEHCYRQLLDSHHFRDQAVQGLAAVQRLSRQPG